VQGYIFSKITRQNSGGNKLKGKPQGEIISNTPKNTKKHQISAKFTKTTLTQGENLLF